MPTPEELDRIHIVLVRARNPNNIGAAARAMHDFGLRHLRVVNDFPVPFESARSAVDASEVLANAVACTSLADAIADCTLVVGTTAVGERNLQHVLLPLPEAAPRILAELCRNTGPSSSPGRVALLFGSEKTGLSNEELSHCNWLLTIPMHQREGERHLSLNLGQAVAVCLYELVREPAAAAHPSSESIPAAELPGVLAETIIPTQPASADDLDRLTTLLAETLERSGYTRRHPANSDPVQLRRLVRRMSLDAGDATVWTGIFRQLLFKLRRFD
jgi:tRNA/rRNA methyltransferase